MALPVLTSPERHALFFDFDGTLVAIAERPDDVLLDDRTRDALQNLYDQTNGATAIITGRDISSVDAFLAPLQLPIAGVHGLTRRDHNGTLHAPKLDLQINEHLVQHLSTLLKQHPELPQGRSETEGLGGAVEGGLTGAGEDRAMERTVEDREPGAGILAGCPGGDPVASVLHAGDDPGLPDRTLGIGLERAGDDLAVQPHDHPVAGGGIRGRHPDERVAPGDPVCLAGEDFEL